MQATRFFFLVRVHKKGNGSLERHPTECHHLTSHDKITVELPNKNTLESSEGNLLKKSHRKTAKAASKLSLFPPHNPP